MSAEESNFDQLQRLREEISSVFIEHTEQGMPDEVIFEELLGYAACFAARTGLLNKRVDRELILKLVASLLREAKATYDERRSNALLQLPRRGESYDA